MSGKQNLITALWFGAVLCVLGFSPPSSLCTTTQCLSTSNRNFFGRIKQSSLHAKKAEARIEDISEKKRNEIVILQEPETQRCIEAYINVKAFVDDQEYIIAYPCDWAVAMAAENEAGDLELVELDSPLMDELFPFLEQHLEQDDIHLFRTPVTLTLQGEFMDEVDAEMEEDEEDEEEEEEDDEDVMSEEELKKLGVEVIERPAEKVDVEEEIIENEPTHDLAKMEQEVDHIATFWYKDVEYSLMKMVDPVLMVAKPDKVNRYFLLSEEEASKVNPLLEKLMLDHVVKNPEFDS
uniref:Uncharacterized protein n=1 Tax=Fibrocapsa japonica TaxID=94617 RepID=A0A7S2V6D6_9STRA|mmetsp:Transcript_6596/g.9977  ORF Transcript_6596/g.9977 Transcript_6596/m.9977 type:complete len:294 (+) Transcript_6596:160-1041(+)